MRIKSAADNCRTLIHAGRYDTDTMLNMLSAFLMTEAITNDEYMELTGLLPTSEDVELPMGEVLPNEEDG